MNIEEQIKEFEEEISRVSNRHVARELFRKGEDIRKQLELEGKVNTELFDKLSSLQNRLLEKIGLMDNAADELKQE